MAKTLLAVDDSVTMRRVLEITFSGEDFRVITAESSQAALGKLGENPQVIVVDTILGTEDGYALAKEIRKRTPLASIVMLASRYSPYDQARGRDAGADDWADKPFDTQQLIDKIRKVMLAKEAGGAPAVGAPGGPYRAPAPPVASAPIAAAPPPAPSPVSPASAQGLPPLGRGTQPSLGGAAAASQRTGTLVFNEGAPPQAAPLPPRPAPAAPHAPVAAAPPAPAAPQAPAPVAPPAGPQGAVQHHVTGAVNGQLAGKLGALGLSPEQADAVLALSREVVERVVWEVVPQLAEAIIKEEIARLTRE